MPMAIFDFDLVGHSIRWAIDTLSVPSSAQGYNSSATFVENMEPQGPLGLWKRDVKWIQLAFARTVRSTTYVHCFGLCAEMAQKAGRNRHTLSVIVLEILAWRMLCAFDHMHEANSRSLHLSFRDRNMCLHWIEVVGSRKVSCKATLATKGCQSFRQNQHPRMHVHRFP